MKKIKTEIDSLSKLLDVESLNQTGANAIASTIDKLLTRLNPRKLSGANPDEVGDERAKLKAYRDKAIALRVKETPATEHAADEQEPGESERERSSTSEETSAREEVAYGVAETLDALNAVLDAELGVDEADRLRALALSRLAAERNGS